MCYLSLPSQIPHLTCAIYHYPHKYPISHVLSIITLTNTPSHVLSLPSLILMVLTGSDESKLRTFQGPSQDQISGYKDFHGEFHNADIYKTRRSENDNTPQPLDQWTNSSFIGQQVGNCKSFTLTHYFADLSAMHRGRRSIPLCIQHHIQLTSLSFQVSQTSHCWVTAISIFYLENPRSRSRVRSKFEVTMWV